MAVYNHLYKDYIWTGNVSENRPGCQNMLIIQRQAKPNADFSLWNEMDENQIQNRRYCQEVLNTTNLQAGNLYCTDARFWVPSNRK
jgi:hypothetical protein